MGFVDMRKPVSFDWLLVLFCPSGVIAYHGHRASITRTETFLYSLLGALVYHAFFWTSVRNQLLAEHYDNTSVVQAAMQMDWGVSLAILIAVPSLVLILKARSVLVKAFQLKRQIQEETEKAFLAHTEYTPPQQVFPPKASDYPWYQDILLYIISPSAMAGLYNRRRWGMVAGLLGFYRLGLFLSPVVAKLVSEPYYNMVRDHVLKETSIDIFKKPEYFDEVISKYGYYDLFFMTSCILYSLYSIFKSRRENLLKWASKIQ